MHAGLACLQTFATPDRFEGASIIPATIAFAPLGSFRNFALSLRIDFTALLVASRSGVVVVVVVMVSISLVVVVVMFSVSSVVVVVVVSISLVVVVKRF